MDLILNNPYRITGLLVGATAREQDRQVKRLKQYIEAEQEPQDDFSFSTLGSLNRTVDSVSDASSKLNLDSDKINAAMFWFWNGNPITDEAAFDALKDGDIDTAYQIWDKLITETKDDGKRFWKPVTEKNHSAFHNSSILNIIRAKGNLHNAIAANLYFLESDLVQKFASTVVDKTHKTNKKELQLLFLNHLHSDIETNKKIPLAKFLEILSKLEFVAKEDFFKTVVQKPIKQIESKVAAISLKRNENPRDAEVYGNELYNEVITELNFLKSIIGDDNIKYQSICDKVSNELLQCGIDFFKEFRDEEYDPSAEAMDLFEKAEGIACGSVATQRIHENTKNLQEWIDDKPNREKQAKTLEDFEKLKNLIGEFEERNHTIANSKQLLARAKPLLHNIRTVLGSNNEIYLGFCSRIASDAQGMCISEINKQQEKIANTYDNVTKVASIILLKDKVNEAWDVTTTIGSMELNQDFRIKYQQNRNALSNIKSQLENINHEKTPNSNTEGIPSWIKIIGGIILFIILIKACSK